MQSIDKRYPQLTASAASATATRHPRPPGRAGTWPPHARPHVVTQRRKILAIQVRPTLPSRP